MNPVIEAFRGAAALAVLLHHYSYQLPGAAQPGSWLALHFFHNGVDLFFVITGFLFAPHLLQGSRLGVPAFAVRRAFRLYPLYGLSLLIGTATLWGGRPDTAEQLLRHLLFVQALPVFPLADVGYFSMAYWTLPVEVAFYALVCVALWYHGGKASGSASGSAPLPLRRLAAMGAISLAGFMVSSGAAGPAGDSRWIHWQGQLPALLIEFWFGTTLFCALPWLARRRLRAWLALACGIALFAVLFASYADVAQGGRAPRPFGVFNVLSALGYALVLGACLGLLQQGCDSDRQNGWPARAGVAAGGLSYGIYLFHDIALGWVARLAPALAAPTRLLAALLLTLLLAAVLHRLVEEPMRALGRRLSAAPRPRD